MKKKINKKGISYLLAISMLFSVSSCDLFDLDVNTNPNNPSQASLDLLLANAIYSGSSTFAGGLNNAAMGFVALNTSVDDFSMTNQSWNTTFNLFYNGPLNDLQRIIDAATEQGNNPHYLGIAQVLKAYYFSLMVDLWGNIPYSEAFKGDAGIKAPVYDDAVAIYVDLINLLDQAKANFDLDSPVDVDGDLIYDGDIDLWIKAANSIKLRLLVHTRNASGGAWTINNTSQIDALIAEDNFISAPAEDFELRFGLSRNPDQRHPMYQSGYAGGEAGYTYFGHQLMAEMLANRDPRTPFYFKRQTDEILDPSDPTDRQTIPCSQRDDCFYNYFVTSPVVTNMVFGKDPVDLTEDEAAYLAGFFGRDRSDPSGIPNDNPIRTTVGAYPSGGLFDDEPESGGGNKGSGRGVFPMVTSWMVKFYLIEAQLTMGIDAGVTNEELLGDALTEQFDKVFSIGLNDSDASDDVANWAADYDWPIDYTEPEDFVDDIVIAYTATADNQKLNYVLKQAWYANFGNGFEVYNAFRRTGLPNDLQEPLQLPRNFALRLPYAQDELNLNPANTPTIVYDDPAFALFWDAVKFQF